MKYPSVGSFISSHGSDMNAARVDTMASTPRSSRAITSSSNPRASLSAPNADSNSSLPRFRMASSTASIWAIPPGDSRRNSV